MRRNHKYLKSLFQKNLAVCLCFLIFFGTVSVEADETESIEKGYSYRLIETAGGEKYAAVTAYMGNETALVVPEKLGGCPVREVNLNFFNMADSMRYEKIRSIVFPNTVVNLNSRACIYFDNLESVVIPEGTESIGADAFLGCSNLKNITIPASVTNIYGRISDNETLQYRVQNGSYADEYLTRSEKNVLQIGEKVSVNDLQIEGKKDCSKTLKFISPSESRTVCLEAEIFPINASNRRLEWKVDGTDVISFDDGMGLNNHGSKFYFDVKKGGTAKITAVSEDGGYTAVCTVHAIVSLACQKIALANDIFMYDGKEKRPRVMIDGLTEGKDYTVAYKNNILAGTGTVTITGIGSNTGQVVKKFTIKQKIQTPIPASKDGTAKTVSPDRPSGFKVKNIKKNKAKLTWKTVKSADGYEIYRSTKKNGRYKRIKVIKRKFTISFINSKLKRKKQYFYKIRSYRMVGGAKSYSTFTGAKKVTIKK